VSKRTFFGCFGSKEDLALSVQEDWETAGMSEFAARPQDEPVITAIRRAVRAGYQSLAEDDERRPPNADRPPEQQRLARLTELMSASPALFAASLQRTAAHADDLIRLIAERMGADPATDLRPRLVAAATQARSAPRWRPSSAPAAPPCQWRRTRTRRSACSKRASTTRRARQHLIPVLPATATPGTAFQEAESLMSQVIKSPGPVFQYVMPGNCARACSSWLAHSRGQPNARAAWPLMSAAAAPLVKWTYSPQFIGRV
jgi:AcrR family transcriptional regulator